MIPLAEARHRVLERCAPIPASPVPLAEALGCVTATDVIAADAVPPFPNASMDGFALRSVDTAGAPVTLAVVATTMAGMPPSALGPGEAVRIMTGAPMPAGADAVCMFERTEAGPAPDRVIIGVEVAAGDFVRPVGDDVAPGDLVFPTGTVLGPGHLGVLATLGATSVTARRRLRVGVLSTGDELVAPPASLRPGTIRDSNRATLAAALARADCVPVDLGIAGDDESAIGHALDAASGCDAVTVSGGVSVGDADLVKSVLDRRCRGSMEWMQVAIKPAKPFAFGTMDEGGVPVFGLPGNPVSALVSFELFARPALRKMAGHRRLDRPSARAVADEALRRVPDGKVHFQRVRARVDGDGRLRVWSAGGQQSHQLRALALADALAVLPDGDGVPAGGEVRVLVLDQPLPAEEGALAEVLG